VNGTVVVESEAELARRREQRKKNRSSRWDAAKTPAARGTSSATAVVELGYQHTNTPLLQQPRQFQAPTNINLSNLENKEQQLYLAQMGIRDCTNRLNLPNLGIPMNPKDRSPSPEPVYDTKGMRTNTRYNRTFQKLTGLRNSYVSKLKALDPTYQPPTYYKDSSMEVRIEVPAEMYPQYNFPGLILGPRGNHLKEMEKKYIVRIAIKGKGSIKEGMTGLRKDGSHWEGSTEPMHITITGLTGSDGKKVKACKDTINALIKLQIDDPDGEKMVAIRAQHMHELATLNGTLKEFDMKCLNCGASGHKAWECPEKESLTFSTICTACGGVGHVTSDCKQKRPGQIFNRSAGGEELDGEYEAFLDGMGIGGKKVKLDDDKPYVPPMGSVESRFGQITKSKPRLMLTDGSAAPGAASAAVRKASKTGMNPFDGPKTIFGSKPQTYAAGFSSKLDLEKSMEERPKKPDVNLVPTHWQAERHDRLAAKKAEQELLLLEHAKLVAKMQKNKEKNRVIRVDGPPPPPPGSHL